MNNITLKLATEKDVSIFIELEKSVAHLKVYSAMISEDEVKKEFEKNTIYLIENNNKIVGSIEYEIKNPDHAYISGFVVNPKFQGQGIGREALRLILERLKDIRRIDLVTHPDNPVLNLYKSFGFVVESRIENYFGDGEPRVVLAKTT
ncbi:MAG: GNAT family N-acetyltransferase [Candidatus Paceibacterota bacterium]|jgi:ribosomal protein S18 acetylase RimI-like enzyme